jgi:hypothetical protein
VSTFYAMSAGELGPQTLAEVIFCMVYIAVNILLWAWIIGSVVLLVARADEASARYRHRMHALERYGSDKGLPQVGGGRGGWFACRGQATAGLSAWQL